MGFVGVRYPRRLDTPLVPLVEGLESRLLLSADLSVAMGNVTVAGKSAATTRIVPGDYVQVELLLTNVGDQNAIGRFGVELFGSADTALDGLDELMTAPSTRYAYVRPGQTVRHLFSLSIPTGATPGDYYLIARITPEATVGDANAANDVAASLAPARLRWMSGMVDGRRVVLRLSEDDGTGLLLQVVNGTAELTPNPGGAPDLAVTGTTAYSSVMALMTARGADGVFALGNVNFDSAVGTVMMSSLSIGGDLQAPGGARLLYLGDLNAAAHQTVTLGSSPLIASTMIMGGRFRNVQIDSDTALSMLRLGEWLDDDATADRLTAPSLGTLYVLSSPVTGASGNFQADLVLGRPGPAQPLNFASIGGQLSQGLWDIGGRAGTITAGSIAADWRANFTGSLISLLVRGDMAGSLAAASFSVVSILGNVVGGQILAGTDLGRDAALGGTGEAEDTFGAGGITSLIVRGQATGALVTAGLHPGDEQIGDLNDLYLGGSASAIRVASFGGLDAASQVAAAQLPYRVIVAGRSVNPNDDARFGQNRFAMRDSGTTDANGEVVLNVAGQPQTFRLADEQTLLPLSGFWASVAVDAQTLATGLAVFVDPSGRRPTQFMVLRGSAAPQAAQASGRQLAAEAAPVLAAEEPDVISVYAGNVSTRVITDQITDKLTAFFFERQADETAEQFALRLPGIKEAVGFMASSLTTLAGMGLQMADTLSNGAVARTFAKSKYAKTELLTPEQALAKIKSDRQQEGITTALMLTLGGNILELGNPYTAAGMALDLMGDQIAKESVSIAVGLPNMGVRVTSLFGFDIYSLSPLTMTEQMERAGQVSVYIPNAADMTSGSLELIRKGDIGTSMLIPLDQTGSAVADVPAGDYRAILRGPGFKTAYQDVSVDETGLDIEHTMEDPPVPGATVDPTDGLVTTEAGGTAQFSVVLNTAPTANVTIPLASSDATEGVPLRSSLVFTPANWNVPQVVTVRGSNDLVADGDMDYAIRLGVAISTDLDYRGINPPDVALTNLDNDAPPAGLPLGVVPVGLSGGIQYAAGGTNIVVNAITLPAYGGSPLSGYTWTLANGSSFPVGTTVDRFTGVFHGTGAAIVPGIHTFTMVVSDGTRVASAEFTFEAVEVPANDILGAAVFQQNGGNLYLPDATVGRGYGWTCLVVVGGGDSAGVLPLQWILDSGSLPPGMSIDPASGVLRGAPQASAAGQDYWFTVTVTDALGVAAVGSTVYNFSVI
ncbi:MAG TPA: Ig domain-containing protein [Phycisphaerae bacterium]|nr:Ig domain-containing protein [Phycisphaerae bacterium]HQL72193.1 Ig domain-containing protein [Phycisphaerae bacterium]